MWDGHMMPHVVMPQEDGFGGPQVPRIVTDCALPVLGPIAGRVESLPGTADTTGSGEASVRAAALPGALVFAWVAVKAWPALAGLLGMWVHETGHAVTAWLCGYQAFPGPWVTPVTTDRSPFFTLLVAGLVVAGGYRAWQARRRF